MTIRRRWRVLAAATVALLAMAGCGSTSDRPADPSRVRAVTVLTGFGMQGQDAYLHLGKARGWFAAEGIDLHIKPGAGTADNLRLLLAGQAQAATIDMTGGLIAYGQSVTDFRVIMAVYQRSISAITTLTGSGITRPADLEGRTVGYTPGGVNHTLFPVYARLTGINPKTIRWRQTTPAQLRGLLAAGTLDAITETVIGTPGVQAAAKGRQPVVLPYSDVLADLYGNVIAVSTATDPDLARRFRAAALRSLNHAIDHPHEAADAFHTAVPPYPRTAALAEVTLMRSYVHAAGRAHTGALDPPRVARGIAVLQGLGAIPAGITPEQVVDFTHATPQAGRRTGTSTVRSQVERTRSTRSVLANVAASVRGGHPTSSGARMIHPLYWKVRLLGNTYMGWRRHGHGDAAGRRCLLCLGAVGLRLDHPSRDSVDRRRASDDADVPGDGIGPGRLER